MLGLAQLFRCQLPGMQDAQRVVGLDQVVFHPLQRIDVAAACAERALATALAGESREALGENEPAQEWPKLEDLAVGQMVEKPSAPRQATLDF